MTTKSIVPFKFYHTSSLSLSASLCHLGPPTWLAGASAIEFEDFPIPKTKALSHGPRVNHHFLLHQIPTSKKKLRFKSHIIVFPGT